MSHRYNVGVIGCGYWGPNLIRNFNALTDDCRMAMVCDRSHDRLRHMKSLYPAVETVTEPEAIIENDEIDAIAVATPVNTHYDLARRSLLAGKHTFVEKPMATSTAECRELVELAEERGLTLMVGHTFIYSSPVRYIEKLIREGELGDIYYVSSRRLNLGIFQKDINVTWDLAPHDLSIILFILKEVPLSVNCQGKSHINGLEDMTNLSIDLSNGTFATVQSSWLDPNKIREMTIVGSKRMVVYNDTEPNDKIRIYDKRVETPPHYDTFAEFHFSYHYGDMRVPFIQQSEPLKLECKHFLDCIRTGATSDSSGRDGLRVVQILEAASESLRQGGARVTLQLEHGATNGKEKNGKCSLAAAQPVA